jgi:hypothetical protein
MPLLMPWILRLGHRRWGTLVTGMATTILLYLVTIMIAARFGVRL